MTAVLAPGDVIAGGFELVRLLGQGGMGEVFEARHIELNQPVALKVMSAELFAEGRGGALWPSSEVVRVPALRELHVSRGKNDAPHFLVRVAAERGRVAAVACAPPR